MEKIEKYRAFDGTLFDSEHECALYEAQIEKQIDAAVDCVKLLSAFCNNMCKDCYFNISKKTILEPYCLFSNKPSDWVKDGVIDFEPYFL